MAASPLTGVPPLEPHSQGASRHGALARASLGERFAGGATRAAEAVHWLTLAGAVGFWVWLGRGLWFFGDEWDFLVRRGLSYAPSSHRGIWFPHNEHWSTLPILLWRAIYSVVHLSSYWPYLVWVLLAQVIVWHLTWRLCRRCGVHAWVATAAVAVLAFLGAGAGDILSAFQVGFIGSVLFGLLAIDLLDGERPLVAGNGAGSGGHRAQSWWAGHKDALASLALLASLMCSTVGDAMLVGAALLLLARRPARRAVAVLALPVASYAIWFAALGRPGISAPRDTFALNSFTTLPGYVWNELALDLGQTFNLEAAGTALLVGLTAWAVWQLRHLWRDATATVALAAAALTFYGLAGVGRDLTAGASSLVVSRYVDIAVTLLMPLIAKLLSSATSWAPGRLVVVGVLAATVLGEVGQAQSWSASAVTLETSQKIQLAATGRLLAQGVPDVSGPGASPVGLYPSLSAAALVGLERSGYVPDVSLTSADLANARAALAVGTWDGYRTSLLGSPLFKGRFELAGIAHGLPSWQRNGCLQADPQTLSPAMEIWLRVVPGQKAASARVIAPPALPNLTNYLYALVVPAHGQASTVPVEVEMPNSGTGYLSYDYPAALLVLTWDIGAPLEFCGLARP
ncbi:MAG TPA: hypothetical protein VL984_11475 [Acidimicrobiales bacterium]|nr:hypothetical protein [Acidimicrobiales bacterium]